jgi:glycosyltransferase involved in cell wall biosynthesis
MTSPELYQLGVSVVICCHNSATRICKTLEHIAKQIPVKNPWEVILVDNVSADSTEATALKCWPKTLDIPFRIVKEKQLGLMYARKKGIEEAKYEIVSFIDDDNWVQADWVSQVVKAFSKHSEIAICGSFNEPVSDNMLPWWFEKFHRSYAVGPQDTKAGDVTWKRGVVFGAGLSIRKEVWQSVLASGFSPLLTGRQGDKLTCGEDYEMCLVFRLAGYQIWYEPSLRLQHYLPPHRLTWDYLRKLYYTVGVSSLGLDPYYYIRRAKPKWSVYMNIGYWQLESLKCIKYIFINFGVLIRSYFMSQEGNEALLQLEKQKGRLTALLQERGKYDKNILIIKKQFRLPS